MVKAHPPINITTANVAFSSLDVGVDQFWKAISTYFSFGGTIVDAGGIDRTYVTPLTLNNATVFNFTSQLVFPALTAQAVADLIHPISTSLTAAVDGITNITSTQPATGPWSSEVLGEGAPVRDERFASRLKIGRAHV